MFVGLKGLQRLKHEAVQNLSEKNKEANIEFMTVYRTYVLPRLTSCQDLNMKTFKTSEKKTKKTVKTNIENSESYKT